MKKLLSIILAMVLVLSLASTAFAVDLSGMSREQLMELKHQIDVELSKLNAPTDVLVEGDLGSFHVAIISAVKGEDYEKNPAVTVKYYLTNNGTEAVSPITSVYLTVQQNGQDLKNTVVLSDNPADGLSTFEDIAPQTSKELKNSYLLIDDSPLTIKAALVLDFTGSVVPLETVANLQ